jgi:hypothetical protein
VKNVLRLLPPLFVAVSLLAQDAPYAGGAGAQTSHLPVPKADDTRFVVDDGPGLDTGCTYRDGGPLIIHIPIRRYVGDPFLAAHSGALSATAKLRMPVYDVDSDGNPEAPSIAPEVDRVYVNGYYAGDLTGTTNRWNLDQFTFPIEWLRFPKLGEPPADNEIRIEIDQRNVETVWCTAADWVELQFDAVAPVFLVHGLLSSGASWPPAFTNALRDRGIPYSNDIDLPKAGSILGNGRALGARLHELAAQFGATRCHIVAHSKGGLDARAYLNTAYDPQRLKVLSLYTLATPHRGSPAADSVVQELRLLGRIRPLFAILLALMPGAENITSDGVYAFTRQYPVIPPGIDYVSLGADADLNHDETISIGEAVPLNAALCDWFHGAIGNSQRVTVYWLIRGWGNFAIGIGHATFGPWVTNDCFVPVQSAAVDGRYLGTVAGNHSTIKSRAVADTIIGRILNRPPANRVLTAETDEGGVATSAVINDSFPLTPSNRTRTFNVTVDASKSVSFFVVAPSRTLTVTATAPGGAMFPAALVPLEDEGTTGGSYIATVASPVPGAWSLTVGESAELSAPLDVVTTAIFANATQSVLLGGNTEAFPLGQKIRLAFAVLDRGQRLTGLTIVAQLRRPDDDSFAPLPIAFRDDGADADTVAGDGVYEAFVAPPAAGDYAVRVESLGTASTGAFRRSGATRLRVVPRTADITALADEGVDDDADELFDRVVVTPHAMLETAGTYAVFVRLRASNDKELLRSIESVFAAGPAHADVPFAADAIARDLGVDGPYAIAEVRYSRIVDGEPVPAEVRYDLGHTHAYTLAQLQHERIRLSGDAFAKGRDPLGNGRYGALEVQLGILSEVAGAYSWSVTLRDRDGRQISFITGDAELAAGVNTLQLIFPGDAIARNRVNGPWSVTNLAVYNAGQSLVVNDVFTTPAFRASDFGPPVRRRTARH